MTHPYTKKKDANTALFHPFSPFITHLSCTVPILSPVSSKNSNCQEQEYHSSYLHFASLFFFNFTFYIQPKTTDAFGGKESPFPQGRPGAGCCPVG